MIIPKSIKHIYVKLKSMPPKYDEPTKAQKAYLLQQWNKKHPPTRGMTYDDAVAYVLSVGCLMTDHMHSKESIADMDSEKPRVYFAGKIKKCEGRTRDDRINVNPDESNIITNPDYIYAIEKNSFVCLGPIVIGDDHGCCHGPTTHGCRQDCSENLEITRKDVLNRCMIQIDAADVVVITIDPEMTAYGTLTEVGVAYAKKKLIMYHPSCFELITNKQLKELWFGLQMSLATMDNDPKRAKYVYYALDWQCICNGSFADYRNRIVQIIGANDRYGVMVDAD